MASPRTQLLQTTYNSFLGPIYLVASEKGLQGVYLRKQAGLLGDSTADTTTASQHKILATAKKQFDEYFLGIRKNFDLPLDISGTKFQKSVWLELSKIPYGETRSYKDIAVRIRKNKAFRAVGTANGKNPFCIVVPCHRVISADGTLGGYSGGLKIKKQLLALEGAKHN
jgi:methylated-DNA-[protein]-cysteine S-methyltransferase